MTENAAATRLIKGNSATDDRGTVRFINDFKFENVCRFYQVENSSLSIIRAFHGHMREAKYVYVASGTALVCAVPLDDQSTPSCDNKVERFVLSAASPQVLYIPPAHANGFKALEPDTRLIFFSTSSLEESLADDFRFPFDYWGADIWNTDNG